MKYLLLITASLLYLNSSFCQSFPETEETTFDDKSKDLSFSNQVALTSKEQYFYELLGNQSINHNLPNLGEQYLQGIDVKLVRLKNPKNSTLNDIPEYYNSVEESLINQNNLQGLDESQKYIAVLDAREKYFKEKKNN